MKRFLTLLFVILVFSLSSYAQKNKGLLLKLLGDMPKPPPLTVDTLGKVSIDGGWRYKIRYLSEDSNTYFHSPKDYIDAYLFIPRHTKDTKLPAIIAIHQDGAHNYIGKDEPAGIAGDEDQHYGIELFKRGYIVICPDRFCHGNRRRIANPDTTADLWNEGTILSIEHWGGQLLSIGRTAMGKEVYDLERTMDVLYSIPAVDKSRIGAIGHSAGGNALAYFMFADPRVKLGVSSCGVFEMANWYDEKAPMKRYTFTVIPNFVNVARTSDFVALIAPRPFLMTRGLWEWGQETDEEKTKSIDHVKATRLLYNEALPYYATLKSGKDLKVIYFDEDGGRHAFPTKLKRQVYEWIDSYLKN
ncbi:S9 family peptidase [Mucilaginibacter sp. L3T2-6]|uniref:alpha/beta hydrolase family protein n=1 Tax=Mucilaginibacter sp. L3T2-6 TaxID=3062491 RepID=UPI00267507D8|nr:prolyl oligopeptidase family serine peptidase [Mucilaginibacter sp. L3T2-6]MDO3641102.1 prolyl oligopeptidase family serine peptidase [Mucilaginibacter sp. L3T2-6]MDV6213422.1 prolyl oligopeptidase family serine peptidase [Mucilaginibacter sp. L3T2-6]